MYFHTLEAAHYSQQTFGNRIIPDTHLILLPEIIVTQSRTEVYAGWLVRHGSLRRNMVFIDILRNVPFAWRSIDNYDNMYLVCVAKKYDGMLWDWMKSRFISPRPARLGLLYLFIVGGQCHTRPFMHVAGVLGCCTPVCQLMIHVLQENQPEWECHKCTKAKSTWYVYTLACQLIFVSYSVTGSVTGLADQACGRLFFFLHLNFLICHILICLNLHFKSWLLMC